MRRESPIVTFEILSRAIENRMGVADDVASNVTYRVLNYFGYDDEIIDNVLDQDDRRMFYFLQDVQILKTRWEEVILPSGRTWKYSLDPNVNKIIEYATPPEREEVTELGLYESLPEDAWCRQVA